MRPRVPMELRAAIHEACAARNLRMARWGSLDQPPPDDVDCARSRAAHFTVWIAGVSAPTTFKRNRTMHVSVKTTYPVRPDPDLYEAVLDVLYDAAVAELDRCVEERRLALEAPHAP